jgi:hypothetical protein
MRPIASFFGDAVPYCDVGAVFRSPLVVPGLAPFSRSRRIGAIHEQTCRGSETVQLRRDLGAAHSDSAGFTLVYCLNFVKPVDICWPFGSDPRIRETEEKSSHSFSYYGPLSQQFNGHLVPGGLRSR